MMINIIFSVILFVICTAIAGPVFGFLGLIAWYIATINFTSRDVTKTARQWRASTISGTGINPFHTHQ